MKLSTSLLLGAVCYLLAFGGLLLCVEKSNTHLVGGTHIEFERYYEFYLKAGQEIAEHYAVTPEMAALFQQQMSFTTDAGLTFQPSSVKVVAKEVSWERSKTRYTVQGGALSFRGTITAAPALKVAQEALRVVLPKLAQGEWTFPDSGPRGPGLERTAKVFFVYPTAEAVRAANFRSALEAAVAPALLVWGFMVALAAQRAKKREARSTETLDQVQLPRIFQPGTPHVATVFGWTIMGCGVFGVILMAVAWDELGTKDAEVLLLAPSVVTLLIGGLVAYLTAGRLVRAEVTREALVLTRGGKGRRAQAIPWLALEGARPVEIRNRSGNIIAEHLELRMRDRAKPLKIKAAHIAEYPLFRDLICALRSHKHPAPAAPPLT